MVAATETKTIKPDDILRQLNKRRGRPCVIPKEDISVLTAGMMKGDSWRQTINGYYQSVGLGWMYAIIGKEEANKIFTKGKKLKFAGVLEQIGRMGEVENKGLVSFEEMEEVLKIAIEEILAGEKSKEIEKRIRKIRLIICNERNSNL